MSLYSQCVALGYEIKIEQVGDSKHATFHGQFSKEGYSPSHCYSLEWSDDSIRKDLTPALMTWAGLRMVTKVEVA